MNLQEALNYRHNCLICQRPLKLTIPDHPNLIATHHDKGLRVQSAHPAGIMMLFGFDGKYQRNKRDYAVYNKPLQLWKGCSVCKATPDMPPARKIKLKARAVGYTSMYQDYTTLENLKASACLFTFTLFGDSVGNYDLQPSVDIIRSHDEDGFYHWTTHFDRDTTNLESGKFCETLDYIFRLTVPAASLAETKNKEEFIKKFKLYTLFS